MQKKGFTLLEVLIVVTIVASIVLFAVPSYKKAQARSQYQAAYGTFIQFTEGLKMLFRDYYKSTEGIWPSDPVQLTDGLFTDNNIRQAKELNINEIDQDNPLLFTALVTHGYMTRPHNLTDTPFQFYVCNPDGNPDACCDSQGVFSCMYIPQEQCNGDNQAYSWAYYTTAGEYIRKTDRTCN